MLTLKEIRNDLKDIRYYYTHQDIFNNASKELGENPVVATACKYNDAIRIAPPKFYDLYLYLYVKNYTQEAFAEERFLTVDYVQKMNIKLLAYLQSVVRK